MEHASPTRGSRLALFQSVPQLASKATMSMRIMSWGSIEGRPMSL